MACQAPAAAGLQSSRLQIHLVVHDEDRVRLELEETHRRTDGPARLVHERLGLQQPDAMTVQSQLRELAGELPLPRRTVPARELLDDHPAHVVAVAGVLATGIPEADDEQLERRGSVASTPREAH